MRGYSTKAAITTGIREVELTAESLVLVSLPQRRTSRYKRVRSTVSAYDARLRKYVYAQDDPRQLIPGRTFFRTQEEAEVNALAQIHQQIALLQRQERALQLKLAGPTSRLWEGSK